MSEADRDYLLFRLYGPLASWGDIAVGEVRGSFERPSRSAVLGLIAAALGVRRDEEEIHARLAADYGFAVEVTAFGHPMRDYHTVQRPPQRKGADYASRREELQAVPREKLPTTQSYRDYWQDAIYVAALWARTGTPIHPLPAIAEALKSPRFVLYLGRRSCPPALPLFPQVIRAATAEAAFVAAAFPSHDFLGRLEKGARAIYTEEELTTGERLVRRDEPVSRRRWQFAERAEYRRTLPGKEAADA